MKHSKVETSHGSLASYITGFVLSVGLTLAAYFSVTRHLFSGRTLITAIVVLAVVQLIIQLFFFLHLGQESKPRWNLMIFLFMLVVLVTLVFGSLWIMANLNYNMRSPADTNAAVMKDEGISK